jgi:EmrB/QacA subfamily drug resistance transporter
MNLSPLRKWSILVVLSLALAIIIIDTTLLNVSLGAIIKDLSTDIQGIQWVISGYSLTIAALTITGGRLGDLFGRKKMFIAGAIIFALGSFLTSISKNVPTMIIGEALIEGVGAALMMPATQSILVAIFRGRERAIGFGIWGAIAGASAALGPILGGYLTTNYSWRWGFRINIIVALVLVLGAILIPETKDTEEKPKIDWIGVILSSLGLVSFVYGIIESSTYGWWVAKQNLVINNTTISFGHLSIVPIAMLIGLIILAIFILWEKHMERLGETPLVSLKLFSNRQFITGALLTSILSLGQAGLIFIIPVFLQGVRHLDALHTGYSLLPMSLTLLVVSPLGAFISHKVRPKLLIQIGMFINILAVITLRYSLKVDATALSFAPALALYGMGFGLVMSQINNFTLSAVSHQEAGEASGVNTTLRQIGASLGAAIIGAILLTSLSINLTNGLTQSTVIPAQAKPQISEQINRQSSNVEFSGASKFDKNIPQPIVNELTRIINQSTTDANRSALIYGIIFTIIGFVISFILPNKKEVEEEKSIAVGH